MCSQRKALLWSQDSVPHSGRKTPVCNWLLVGVREVSLMGAKPCSQEHIVLARHVSVVVLVGSVEWTAP